MVAHRINLEHSMGSLSFLPASVCGAVESFAPLGAVAIPRSVSPCGHECSRVRLALTSALAGGWLVRGGGRMGDVLVDSWGQWTCSLRN